MPFKNQHPLYSVYHAMKERCRNKNFKQWENYGGRGIAVCSRWLEYKTGFHNFIADMGDRPHGCSIDRIDNNGNYSPENCRWSTKKQQQRNQSVTRTIVISGKKYIAADLADIAGVKVDTIIKRAAIGLSYEEVINPKKRTCKDGLALGGAASGAKKRLLTHCKNGHEFNAKNTAITPEGWRRCRECHRIKQSKINARNAVSSHG